MQEGKDGRRKCGMNCQEFEAVGLGLGRESAEPGSPAAIERAAAIEHVDACPRCAALQRSWQDAQVELRALRVATQDVRAPLRVEMRLRQEFQTRHRTLKVRAAAVVASWALAGAAVLVGAASWWNWHVARFGTTLESASSPAKSGAGPNPVSEANGAAAGNGPDDSANEAMLVAANDAEDFTLLPGSLPQETGDAAVVRVRLQRGALGTLGLPVNEARAGEWIQVDLFVGQDGQPQAVRMPR
jgi:hypothetical protein